MEPNIKNYNSDIDWSNAHQSHTFVKLFIPFTLIYWSSKKVWHKSCKQCAKKVMSNSPGLVKILLSGWWILFGKWSFWEIQITEELLSIQLIKFFFGGLVKRTLGLVHANYSLPKWQAVNWLSLHPGKVSFFPGIQKLASLAAKGKVLFLYPIQIMVQWILHLTGNLLPRFSIKNVITILAFSLSPWYHFCLVLVVHFTSS